MYTYPLSWLQAAQKHGSDWASIGVYIRCHGCRLHNKHGSDWASLGEYLSVVMVAGCAVNMAVIGRV